MAYTLFIDGKEGATGLHLFERLASRNDVTLLHIAEDKRKDTATRRALINESDITVLCLPDEAARESVSLCTNSNTRIIDASTAHRTSATWTYGFPELSPVFRKSIASSKRVAVPGCYASGFNAICYPLVTQLVMPRDYPVVCSAVSGYSGAGKKAIAQYENAVRDSTLDSPRLYALTQQHKHLPEMQKVSALDFPPVFIPYICDYFSGMTVTVPLHARLLARKVNVRTIHEIFAAHYRGCNFITVAPLADNDTLYEQFIAANTLLGTNNMCLFVYGNDERILVTAQFDNLGKGASGAAVQCMNIMLGIDERTGLV
ncbi:MAG: N-acetyl-gamma-glutamyl-phosphate reductase [Treponema sp.]|nr:N-acetyl-gamma-glutamyl-phosphate reductase [Treponema sp.]